jgi:hypothetical protein
VKVDAEDKTKVLSDAEFEVYKEGKKVDTLRTTTLFASTTTSISSFSNLYPCGAFVSFNVYFPGY